MSTYYEGYITRYNDAMGSMGSSQPDRATIETAVADGTNEKSPQQSIKAIGEAAKKARDVVKSAKLSGGERLQKTIEEVDRAARAKAERTFYSFDEAKKRFQTRAEGGLVSNAAKEVFEKKYMAKTFVKYAPAEISEEKAKELAKKFRETWTLGATTTGRFKKKESMPDWLRTVVEMKKGPEKPIFDEAEISVKIRPKLLNTMSKGELERLNSGECVMIRHPENGEKLLFKVSKALTIGSKNDIYFTVVGTSGDDTIYLRRPFPSSGAVWKSAKEVIRAMRKKAYRIST